VDLLSTVHFTAVAWRFVTPATIRSCCAKCGIPVDVSSYDDSALKKMIVIVGSLWIAIVIVGSLWIAIVIDGSLWIAFGGQHDISQCSRDL
jgi:uncharacterized protein (DUF983 family)